ncbi:hypothetical protein CO608_10095 [Lysobacteraceae bacterium NML08-0793]|nr:hypothetical protein CO608_10095 [Xanthomonadaceae bacterium NML08-0793]
MRFLLVTLLAAALPASALACGKKDPLDFAPFVANASPNVQQQGALLQLDTRFVAALQKQPDGKRFDENRNELLYLIARQDAAAVDAGIKVLAHLLQHPEYVTECNARQELYDKEELAFTLSRSEPVFAALCALPAAERTRVLSYYQANPVLWRNIDAPWQPGNLQCTGND